ncbi:MAG: DivIVA domain-containing protein [Actinobacteria bacterium]|nr:DivIVA domain-containing protein [Actinomycetota bacterium]
MKRKKEKQEEQGEPFSAPKPAPRITPEDIQAKEFRIARFRGYRERDVDEYLDDLTLAWSAVVDENDRLRLQARGAIGDPDLDDVSRQADQIIARAREEAAQILREAEARAMLIGAGGSSDRPAVSAFLSKEREFLQSLASLVQGHAEGVKGLARQAYGKPAARAGEAVPAPAEVVAQPEPAVDVAMAQAEPAVEEPIRVEEATPATVPASEPDDRSEPGDRSLRELFWGEE